VIRPLYTTEANLDDDTDVGQNGYFSLYHPYEVKPELRKYNEQVGSSEVTLMRPYPTRAPNAPMVFDMGTPAPFPKDAERYNLRAAKLIDVETALTKAIADLDRQEVAEGYGKSDAERQSIRTKYEGKTKELRDKLDQVNKRRANAASYTDSDDFFFNELTREQPEPAASGTISAPLTSSSSSSSPGSRLTTPEVPGLPLRARRGSVAEEIKNLTEELKPLSSMVRLTPDSKALIKGVASNPTVTMSPETKKMLALLPTRISTELTAAFTTALEASNLAARGGDETKFRELMQQFQEIQQKHALEQNLINDQINGTLIDIQQSNSDMIAAHSKTLFQASLDMATEHRKTMTLLLPQIQRLQNSGVEQAQLISVSAATLERLAQVNDARADQVAVTLDLLQKERETTVELLSDIKQRASAGDELARGVLAIQSKQITKQIKELDAKQLGLTKVQESFLETAGQISASIDRLAQIQHELAVRANATVPQAPMTQASLSQEDLLRIVQSTSSSAAANVLGDMMSRVGPDMLKLQENQAQLA
jgi:hypothetical protein